jgi:hypothetical protein
MNQIEAEKKDKEFQEFFDYVVAHVHEYYKKNNSLMWQMIHVRKNGENWLLPSLTQAPPEIMSSLAPVEAAIKAIQPEFYVVVSEAWQTSNKLTEQDLRARPRGWIGNLPREQRVEVVIIIGRTLNGRNNRHKTLKITRTDPNDEDSKILSLDVLYDDKESRFVSDYLP